MEITSTWGGKREFTPLSKEEFERHKEAVNQAFIAAGEQIRTEAELKAQIIREHQQQKKTE